MGGLEPKLALFYVFVSLPIALAGSYVIAMTYTYIPKWIMWICIGIVVISIMTQPL